MNKNGAKWITRHKRLAIYMRDGMYCAYCGDSVEDGAQLTLDHIIPREKGGSNHERNLITACHKCNSARHDRPLTDFCDSVALYLNHGTIGTEIRQHIMKLRDRKLTKLLTRAKELIASQGSWQLALKIEGGR